MTWQEEYRDRNFVLYGGAAGGGKSYAMTWKKALRERLIANYTKAANRLADEMIARLEAERIEASRRPLGR